VRVCMHARSWRRWLVCVYVCACVCLCLCEELKELVGGNGGGNESCLLVFIVSTVAAGAFSYN